MAALTGADYYTMVQNMLSGFQMNSTLFYQLLNMARIRRELERPYLVLRKKDSTKTWVTSDAYTTAKTMPTDFHYLIEDDSFKLFDGANTVLPCTIVPFEKQLENKDISQTVVVDYANSQFFMNGTTDQTYTIYIFYQADLGDIASGSTWLKVPARFNPILAHDVAAMYRLGVDYDDINARNADDNAKQAELLATAMKKWDASLQRANVQGLDYYPPQQRPFVNHKINMYG